MSSSDDDVPLINNKKRRASDATHNALQLATIQLLTNLSSATAPKAAGPHSNNKAKEPAAGAQNVMKRTVTCFHCNERIEENIRDHTCAQKEANTLLCPHCKVTFKNKTYVNLFEHFLVCPKKYCAKCKSNSHSFYFCGDFKCYECKQFGHSRVLHKFGKHGEHLIAGNSSATATSAN